MADVKFKEPKSLYLLCVSCVGLNLHKRPNDRKDLRTLPENVHIDVYNQMCKDSRVCPLENELCDLDIFIRILKVPYAKAKLLQCFQAVMAHDARLSSDLSTEFIRRADHVLEAEEKVKDCMIDTGLRLGSFLADAGCFSDSEKVLQSVQCICHSLEESEHSLCLTLQCCHRLLYTQSTYCSFCGAAETSTLARTTIDILQSKHSGISSPVLAALYTELSRLHFNRSEYDDSYKWSVEALKHLRTNVPSKIKVDVLRQAAKSCVVKRDFQKARLLIRQAVFLARTVFGVKHPKYSDALLDYGFFLLNVDSIVQSVTIYKNALEIKSRIFGKNNLHVAIALEDLAYALYVHEYSSGRFYMARDHAEKAIDIMQNLVPEDHLMLASAKRVKALILEEIALDNPENSSEHRLLFESEELHMVALKLSLMAFGEKNVQTAKHYGNIGRLYQSMKRFKEAESMHLRAIAIKEELLGPDDYEVGLSIGHLASLYNYHMLQHHNAEKLYHRSIAISLKLFGEAYSGLEYDYRGLIHVYRELRKMEQMWDYERILGEWRDLRDEQQSTHTDRHHLVSQEPPVTVEEVTKQFFEMCKKPHC